MVAFFPGSACSRPNALRKKSVRKHHEDNLRYKRHTESTTGHERSEHKAGALSCGGW